MGTEPSDFMGGLLNFVSDLLNALFRAGTTRTNISIWSSDDAGVPSFTSMTSVTTDGGMPVSMAPPEATVTPQPMSMTERAHDEIASLQKLDPDFSEVGFLASAGDQYLAYLAAEGTMSSDALASIATPDFIQAFAQRVAGWKSAGLQRIVSAVKIIGSAVFKVELDGTRQAIKVRITASGVRYSRDASSGAAVDGSMQSETSTEFVTFVRPPGATTPKSAAAGAATHCPSCGAPTESGAASCPYCGTSLTGTGATWLIDKTSSSAYT